MIYAKHKKVDQSVMSSHGVAVVPAGRAILFRQESSQSRFSSASGWCVPGLETEVLVEVGITNHVISNWSSEEGCLIGFWMSLWW